MVVQVLFALISYAFAMRWTLDAGIPDMAMIWFTDAVYTKILQVLLNLPIISLICKVSPKEIEATVYAF